MHILDEQVKAHLRDLRPVPSEVMTEMKAVAERDSVHRVSLATRRSL